MRLLIILLCVLVYSTVVMGDPEAFAGGNDPRWCTVDELLPGLKDNFSARWSSQRIDTPPFDCSCPMLKARCVSPRVCRGNLASFSFHESKDLVHKRTSEFHRKNFVSSALRKVVFRPLHDTVPGCCLVDAQKL